MRRFLLHEEVLVNVDIVDLRSDIRAHSVSLLRGSGHRVYLSSMLGVDRPFTILIEIH